MPWRCNSRLSAFDSASLSVFTVSESAAGVIFIPLSDGGFDPLVEDVGDRMPQVDARRVDQSDVRRDILAAVARPAQPEFEFVERAENIDAEAERDR